LRHAKLRPLVVQAGALAPRRRDKPPAAGHDCHVALTDAELARHAVESAKQASGRQAWSVAMRLAFKADVPQWPCGGRRSLVAGIDQPAVVKRILAPPCRHRGRFSGWLRKRLQSLRIPSGCPKSRRSAGRGRSCFRRNSVTPGCLWSWMLATRTPANRFLMGCLPAIGQRSCRRKCRIPACRPRGGVLQQPNVQPAPGRGRISLSIYEY
jgi:hypothetical protein